VYTQQVVYATILSRRRQELHAAIADAIAELYPDAAGEQAETLAYHYTHTEHGDRAIEHLMNAGAKARAAYLNDEAVECYRKALATLDGLPETAENVTQRVHVQEALGRIHHGAGNGDAAEGHLRAAIDLGQEAEVGANHLIRLCYWLGDVHWWKSEHARVVEVGEMAAALLGDERGTVEEALVNQTIAMGALFTGNKPVWRSRLERTAEFLRDLPYSEELRPSYVYIWGMRVAERDIAAASEWAAALLHVGTAHHDARATAQAHKGLGDMCWYLGDLAGALAKYETALAVFEEIGDTNHAGDCLIGLGALALAMGRLEDAKRYGGLGLAAAEQIDSAMFRAHSYLSVGELYVCLGDMSVGAHALSRSIELFAESGQRPSEPLVALGWGSLHEGDMNASAGHFHEAVSQSSRLMGSALSGLEQGYADNPDVFPLLCADLAASGSALPSGQWCLEAASPSSFPAPVERMDFIAIRPGGGLGAEWEWDDLHGDGAYAVENVLEIRAPNGRDLSKANVSAPRLLRPVEGDFAADAVSLPGRDDRLTLGGLLLWVDADNFLRVERGIRGHRDVSLRGRVDGADKLLGRGRLDADRIHLRVERRGGSVRALCSADGRAWHSIGETEFTSDPPARVGLHAIGVIERTIYRGAFREGDAIRFESFALRQ
jgi:tetratricopeptide (TPR) repeat protein/regulation of enolase protein 1 (concanavalin A-like superfamily)